MSYERIRPEFAFDQDRLNQLRSILPEVFADGKINWDALRTVLVNDLEEETMESFGLSWPGKASARKLSGTPSTGTLIPFFESDDEPFEKSSENIFIEGENLEVLKILRKSYQDRIKLIYIDPPYNIDGDFIYNDNFVEPLESYLRLTGQSNEAGLLLTTNSKTDGRFHSKWLNMMYPRLRVARDLLSLDGIIMVSISDGEIHHLRVILNEIFGENNFLATFIWVNEGNIDNQSRFKRNHEYVIVYAKNEATIAAPAVIDPNIPNTSKLFKEYIENTIVKNGPANPISDVVIPEGFPANFESGIIKPKPDFWPGLSNDVVVKDYKTSNAVTATSGWSSKAIFESFVSSGFLPVPDTKGQDTVFYFSETGAIIARKRRSDSQGHVLTVLNNMGTVQGESSRLSEKGIKFSYPKPVKLLEYLVQIGTNADSIVLDFFAGSGGIAEAVMMANRKDGGNRKFILAQIPENADKSPHDKVSDITLERIGQMAKEFKLQQTPEFEALRTDVDFKAYKLGRSNIKKWEMLDHNNLDSVQMSFDQFETPLVPDWREENLLIEVMLLQGFPLSSIVQKTTSTQYGNIYTITSDWVSSILIVYLGNEVTQALLDSLALTEENTFICLDSALTDENKVWLSEICNLRTL